MSDGFKRVKVEENTHTQLKTQAAAKGLKLQEYMQYLADMDKGELVCNFNKDTNAYEIFRDELFSGDSVLKENTKYKVIVIEE